ncbi:hypothetical protein AB0J80_13605 [Actinoplanes sp. NPDC049548]|uniref:hypothetical protein n=1 Tax=Actinoplanes sp. NPDC049548 TaxID=3155152 RepID=UPI00341DD74C
MPPEGELVRVLNELRPDEMALHGWVRTRVNASIVRELACLDHGMRVEEHRQGIEEVLDARRLPEWLAWAPGEVLSLAGFERPADPDRRPGSAGWRQHVARLFACLVLVRTIDQVVPAETLAALVESALELGPEATGQAVRYLAWCRLHEPGAWRDDAEALPFLTLGLFLLRPEEDRLARTFVSEVEALDAARWSPTAALRKTAGGDGWRLWRRLVADRTTASTELPRAWFGVQEDA